MASLRVTKRKDTGTLWIIGTVAGRRIRQAAGTSQKRLAQERAAQLEAEILRGAWHGERRGDRSFGAVVEAYAEAKPRRAAEHHRLARLIDLIGERTKLCAIDQETVTRVSGGKSSATLQREIITPLRAVLTWAARRKWCDAPLFETQPEPQGRTLFLLPSEAERLIACAASHLQPLIVFLLGTGGRLSEALELEWRDVDLEGRRVIFWRTKNGKRRIAHLPHRVTVSLAALSKADGRVFLSHKGEPWADADRQFGGQIRYVWNQAIERAGLNPKLTPHCLRHTWATWHYAIHRDLLALKEAGDWHSVRLVERYAHLMPAGHEQAIREFLEPKLRVVA